MRYFVYLRLPGFYVSSLRSTEPGLSGSPLAVHRDGSVLDSSPEARHIGIQVGMSLSEAKAIGRAVAFVACERDAYSKDRRRWLDACSMHSDSVEPGDLHTAFVDLSAHPDPESVAGWLVRDVERATGIRPELGVARTKWMARLSESAGDAERIALADPRRFLSALPVAMLLPVPVEHRRRLEFLGYRKIGDVDSLSPSLLRRQFGVGALLISQAARGAVFEPVEARWPPDSIRARIVFAGGAETANVLEVGLRKLAREMGGKLRLRESQGRRLELILTFEDDDRVSLERTFMRPIHDARSAFNALNLLVENRAESPIESVCATVRDLEHADRRQLEFGRIAVSREIADSPEMRSIRSTFGEGVIQMASQVEMPRRKRVLRAWKEATGWS